MFHTLWTLGGTFTPRSAKPTHGYKYVARFAGWITIFRVEILVVKI
jgi:hypothetical protein